MIVWPADIRPLCMRDIFCLSTALSSEIPSLRRLFFKVGFFMILAVAGSVGGAGTKET